jgi:hypothetical protein
LPTSCPGDLGTGGPKARAAGGLGKAIAALARSSKNKVVQKLAGKADKLSDVADNAFCGVYARNGFKNGTAPAIAKIVIYLMPVWWASPRITVCGPPRCGEMASMTLRAGSGGSRSSRKNRW